MTENTKDNIWGIIIVVGLFCSGLSVSMFYYDWFVKPKMIELSHEYQKREYVHGVRDVLLALGYDSLTAEAIAMDYREIAERSVWSGGSDE